MNKIGHLCIVSHANPSEGLGSHVILLRHLQGLLSNGVRVSVVTSHVTGTQSDGIGWHVYELPMRKWWWPPYRDESELSQMIRIKCWTQNCLQRIQDVPDVVLTLAGTIHALLAMNLARKWSRPLAVIVHDQWEYFARDQREAHRTRKQVQKVLSHASRVWAVSEELLDAYPSSRGNHRESVLLPIPGRRESSYTKNRELPAKGLVLAHAGRLHPCQIPTISAIAQGLRRTSGKLILITPDNHLELEQFLINYPEVTRYQAFSRNEEAVEYVAAEATVFLIPYAFDLTTQPWAKTSFPSRLLEFAQLGIPVLIAAPNGTAIANWGTLNAWQCILTSLEDEVIDTMLHRISSIEGWASMSQQAVDFAEGPFSPGGIQNQFETEMPLRVEAQR